MDTFAQLESEIRGLGRVYPTVFASASNARQTDEAARSWIDFYAGAGALAEGLQILSDAISQVVEAEA